MRAVAVGLAAAVGSGAGERRRISKSEIAELDFSARRFTRGNFGVAIVNLRLRREDIVQASHGRRAALKNIGDPTKRDHRPDQEREIAIERNQTAQ